MALEWRGCWAIANEPGCNRRSCERKQRFDEMVAKLYRSGKALNSATHFGIDEVTDPADSRRWIASTLYSTPAARPAHGEEASLRG